jgi:hypothetical protein
MPNTSKGFPYPTSSDDPNVPQDIQLLAQAVDATLTNYSPTTHTHTGVYATTTHTHDGVYANTTHTHNEYLEPSDLAGYSQTTHTHDSLYSNLAHVHNDYLSTAAISGTKGAIPIGTASGVSIITPGTNDYVLVSDSTTATGTKWANVAAVGTVVPNTFSNIAVSGQTTVSADTTVDTLNLAAGTNVTITTDALTDTITISAAGGDLAGHLAATDPHPQYLTQSEADILYDADGSAAAAQSAANIYTDTAISNLVNAAPSTLNTLKELSDALGGDALFATTVTNALASKAPISNPSFTGTVNFSGATISGYSPFPTQTGQGGKYLTTNGTAVSWATIDLTPYLTSSAAASTYLTTTTASNVYAPKASPTFTGTVDFTGATVTGLSANLPSQIDNTGKFLSTNGNTAQWVSIYQIPDQTDQSGKFLTTDGTTASWTDVSSTPAAGSITSAMIADGTIVDADIAIAAGIDASKIYGYAVTKTDTGSVTNTMLAGSIANNKLVNSSITINGTQISLGASTTIDTLPPQATNSGRYLSTNGTTAFWSTITTNNYSNGTNTSTANKIFYNNTGSFPSATAAGDIYIQY